MLSRAQQNLFSKVLNALEDQNPFPTDLATEIYNATKHQNPLENKTFRDFIQQYVVDNLSEEELFKFTHAIMAIHLAIDDESHMLRTSGILSKELYVAFAKRIGYTPQAEIQPHSIIQLNKIVLEAQKKLKNPNPIESAENLIFFTLGHVGELSTTDQGFGLISSLDNNDIIQPSFKESEIPQKTRMDIVRSSLSSKIEEEKKASDFVFTSMAQQKLYVLESNFLKLNIPDEEFKSEIGLASASARLVNAARTKCQILAGKIELLDEKNADEFKNMNSSLNKLQQQFNKIMVVMGTDSTSSARLGAMTELSKAVKENIEQNEIAKVTNQTGQTAWYTEELAMYVVEAALKELLMLHNKEEKEDIKYLIYQDGVKLAIKYKNNPSQLADLGEVLINTANAIQDVNHVIFLKTVADKHKATLGERFYLWLYALVGATPPKFLLDKDKYNNRLFKQPELGKHVSLLVNQMDKSLRK